MQMASNGSVLCRRKRLDGFSDDVAPLHVLAVDDSFVDRKVIERLLKISSCKVTAVDSGRRALQYLGLDEEKSSGLKVDMIITDYCMPGMTGYELLKKVKGSANLKEIPVVIMSSENILARIDRFLEEGAEDFIVKPVKLSDVKRLKNDMFGEENSTEENRGINKRKEQEPSDLPFPSQPFPSQPSIVSSCSSTCSSAHDTPSQSSLSPSSQESSSLSSPSPVFVDQQSDLDDEL